jgi:hypothetical protein
MSLYNLAKMTTATTGTGTITLGSALPGYLDFAGAGAVDGELVSYAIIDGSNREIGRATYNSSGPTLSGRTVLKSTAAGSAISLSGAALVAITAAAEDLRPFSTGDVKPTLKAAADAGWVLMNDGAIGDGSSGGGARAAADTWALFNLMFFVTSDANCPIYALGGGSPSSRAAFSSNAATAFAAHARIVLPLSLGRVLAFGGAGSGLTSRSNGEAVGGETETPTTSKTASHGHPLLNAANIPPGSAPSFAGTDNGNTTNSVGSGTPLAIVAPRFHANIMIKL